MYFGVRCWGWWRSWRRSRRQTGAGGLRGNRELAFLLLHCRELALRGERELIPIGQAAEKAGISRQSLQYYLMIGLLEPTEVTPTGRRLFDSKAVERIALIKRLNDSGYPLRAIRELFMEGRTRTKGDGGE